MRFVITGSIAFDQLSTFPGRFSEQIVPDAVDQISLSFLVDSLTVHRGGVAANIAFGLSRLGLSPLLVAAAGHDFAEYRSALEAAGVDTRGVLVSPDVHSARFWCTTDAVGNQLASFYGGAMALAAQIDVPRVLDELGVLPDLVVIGPNDPAAMLRHTRDCREAGLAFAADPSQQVAYLGGEDLRSLLDGAAYLFTNEYERGLLLQKTGWSAEDVLHRVTTWVTTLGGDGVQVERRGTPAVRVPAVEVPDLVDPTGVGDAFRAGFLAGVARGLGEERSAQLGCVVAAAALQVAGTQTYHLAGTEVAARLAAAYGAGAAAEIAAAENAASPRAGAPAIRR